MKAIWKRGLSAEDYLSKILIEHFHEVFVHEQQKVIVNEHTYELIFLCIIRQGSLR